MLNIVKLLGFSLLFVRFVFWVGSSLVTPAKRWQLVLLSQAAEALLLLFIFAQLFGKVEAVPLPKIPLISFLGLFLLLLGTIVMFAAKKQLGISWVYAADYRIVPKQKLTTTGIYSLVRNPIYSGGILGFVGAEFLAGSYLWISVLFFFVPAYVQAKKEEKILEKKFGEKYREYKKHTTRFIPYLF